MHAQVESRLHPSVMGTPLVLAPEELESSTAVVKMLFAERAV